MPAWLDFLKAECSQEWNTHGKALMLSRIPAVLTAGGFAMEEILQGRKLRPFLQSECGSDFQVIQSERISIVWGIVPIDAHVSEPFDRYFQRTDGTRATRFAPAAWRAFTLPVPAGKRRWLFDEPSIHFNDFDDDSPPVAGFEIERRYIVEAVEGGDLDTALVLQRIAEWAAELRIDAQRFALGHKKSATPKADPAVNARGTALDQLLKLMLPSELTRVVLPLDVIARLHTTRLSSGS